MNPNMMGMQMGQLPNVPTTKELWKNEKSKYRQWMILFAIGVAIVFTLLLISAIYNWIGIDSIIEAKEKYYNENFSGKTLDDALKGVHNEMFLSHVILPFISTGVVGVGLVLYLATLYDAYKNKNFGKLSGYTTFVIGVATFYSFFSIMQIFWKGPGGILDNPGGIFQFVNYFLLIGVYFGGSSQVSKIRRTFLMSEKIEKIKSSPEYQAAQQQAGNAPMNGQAPINPIPNPYGPAGVGTPVGAVNTTNTTTQANPVVQPEPQISKERQQLEKMSVSNLKKVAKKLSISGYSTMKKPELIINILRVTSSN